MSQDLTIRHVLYGQVKISDSYHRMTLAHTRKLFIQYDYACELK